MPFRDVVNEALRRAMAGPSRPKARVASRTYASRLKPGFDPGGFNALADELEDDSIAATLRRAR